MKLKLAFLCVLTVAGCATKPVAPELAAAAAQPLYCYGVEQCALYWKRAQLWVVNNSGWKIQLATDTLIETYNPIRSSTARGYRITKEPQGNGREQIRIATACANMFGCGEPEEVAVVKFKSYVSQVN